MANINRSSIVGFHNIKNKVSRNAFDLSHRHMFTAQIGELLPIFVQWCNPNETFKLGYNGFTRTQPLQTAAFTRLKENVQYYFVPFQSLWRYFEQQVNNMTTGQSGENISRIALSPSSNSPITTSMPYFNYTWLKDSFKNLLYSEASKIVSFYNSGARTFVDFVDAFRKDGSLFLNENLLHCSTAKLLSSLGYGNFPLENYDLISSFVSYINSKPSSVTVSSFINSEFGYYTDFASHTAPLSVTNSPNLSIFPLLAYHKILNDHYIYRQWQPFKSYSCNIDYLSPSDSMNMGNKFNSTLLDDLFRLGYSNLPLDYFNGVLPKAQYSEESAASVDVSSGTADISISGNSSQPYYTSNQSFTLPGASNPLNVDQGTVRAGSVAVAIHTPHTHTIESSGTATLSGISSSLKVSALRSAVALQKYKEIQESNDPDFASQVLAHYGIKPKHSCNKSVFIGGGDSVIDINPQINQNLTDGNDPDIKATGSGQLSCGCKFTSDTFGIIIGIYRCVPQLDLAHVGIDRNLFKTDASDWAIPEFDRLGMQSQYRCEVAAPYVCVARRDLQRTNNPLSVDMSATYGYLPRYAELKTSYDRYDGAFKDSLSSWVTGYSDQALTSWVSSFTGTFSSVNIDKLLRCSPLITYPLFVDQSSVSSNSDKLLIGSVNTCVAVRPYSVYGLPYSK